MAGDWKKKLDNFWYYYKGWVIFGICAVVFIAVAIAYNIVTHEDYDYKVLLVTDEFVPDTLGATGVNEIYSLRQALEKYGTDLNGDGEVNVEVLFISSKDGGMYNHTGATMELMTTIKLGQVMLYISDQVMYEEILKTNAAEPIDTPAGKEMGFNWKDSRFRKSPGLERFPDDMYFTVRVISENIKNIKGVEKRQKQAKELLHNIMFDIEKIQD